MVLFGREIGPAKEGFAAGFAEDHRQLRHDHLFCHAAAPLLVAYHYVLLDNYRFAAGGMFTTFWL